MPSDAVRNNDEGIRCQQATVNSGVHHRLLFALACIALAFAISLAATSDAWAGERAITGKSNEVSVLFVGNSFTYFVGIGVPEPLKKLADANGKDLHVGRVSYGGVRLSDFAYPDAGTPPRYKAFIHALQSHTWDYVVLQEQSLLPIASPMGAMYDSVLAARSIIGRYQPRAKVLLFMTHGYPLEGAFGNLSESDMQLMTQSAYERIGDRLKLRVVPAGMYIQAHRMLYPDIDLLVGDYKHPNANAYFIAACAFYEAIFGEAPWSSIDESFGVDTEAQLRAFDVLGSTAAIKPSSIVLAIGQTAHVELDPNEPAPACASLNPSVATLEADGTVTAHGEGSTIVYTQSAAGARATCAVTVENERLTQEKLLVDPKSAIIDVGEELMVGLSTSHTLDNPEISWTSSSPQVATVDGAGDIAGISPGVAKITAQDEKSGHTASTIIYVRCPKPAELTVAGASAKSNGKTTSALRLEWPAVRGATNYEVFRSYGNGAFKLIATTSSRTYTDAKLQRNILVRYRIIAANMLKECDSLGSPIVYGIALERQRIAARTGKQGKAVELRWKANAAADGYHIYRAEGINAPFELAETITSNQQLTWIDKTAKRGKTYRYRISSYRACDGIELSGPESPIAVAR